MAQPVIVSSGHTFDCAAVVLCTSLSFTPTLPDGTTPDFSTLIPNLALRSAILNFCAASSLRLPTPHHIESAVLAFISAQRPSSPSPSSPACLLTHHSSSDEDGNDIVAKLRSQRADMVEKGVRVLRKTTRSSETSRILLCTPNLLSALKSVVASSNAGIQADAVAAVVNLSLEKTNKVKILRSGIVPLLIENLKSGFSEARDHACSALFSLALDDANRTALGVLGALPPLVRALRSATTQNDAAWALYHLSLVQTNRAKMVKLGAVQNLLNLVHQEHIVPISTPVMLILRNMAACEVGRAAMLDAGAVSLMVKMLGMKMDSVSVSNMKSCIGVLYELSRGGLRFRILAKEARSVEVLSKVEECSTSDRVKEMAKKVMEAVMEKWEEVEEDVDWEELIDSGLANAYRSGHSGYSSSHF